MRITFVPAGMVIAPLVVGAIPGALKRSTTEVGGCGRRVGERVGVGSGVRFGDGITVDGGVDVAVGLFDG